MIEIENFTVGKITHVHSRLVGDIPLSCDYKGEHYHVWVCAERPDRNRPIALSEGKICQVHRRGSQRVMTSASGLGKVITEELLREARSTNAIETALDANEAEKAAEKEQYRLNYAASCKQRAGVELYDALEAMLDAYDNDIAGIPIAVIEQAKAALAAAQSEPET